MNKHRRINLITHILILSMLLSGIIYVPITAQEVTIEKSIVLPHWMMNLQITRLLSF
jgi:hypothetical protein